PSMLVDAQDEAKRISAFVFLDFHLFLIGLLTSSVPISAIEDFALEQPDWFELPLLPDVLLKAFPAFLVDLFQQGEDVGQGMDFVLGHDCPRIAWRAASTALRSQRLS